MSRVSRSGLSDLPQLRDCFLHRIRGRLCVVVWCSGFKACRLGHSALPQLRDCFLHRHRGRLRVVVWCSMYRISRLGSSDLPRLPEFFLHRPSGRLCLGLFGKPPVTPVDFQGVFLPPPLPPGIFGRSRATTRGAPERFPTLVRFSYRESDKRAKPAAEPPERAPSM